MSDLKRLIAATAAALNTSLDMASEMAAHTEVWGDYTVQQAHRTVMLSQELLTRLVLNYLREL